MTVAGLMVVVPAARAETVTVGSTLPPTLTPAVFGASATVLQTSVPGGIPPDVPFNGIVTSWRIRGAAGGPFTLQATRVVGDRSRIVVGEAVSGSGPVSGPGIFTFAASLPVQAGDQLAVRSTAPGDQLGAGPIGSGISLIWSPPLTIGAPPRDPDDLGDQELGYNATIESNCVVPQLKGKKLKKAKQRVRAGNCTVGKVQKKGGRFVRKQRPKAGSELPPGGAVKLVTGPKKKAKK